VTFYAERLTGLVFSRPSIDFLIALTPPYNPEP